MRRRTLLRTGAGMLLGLAANRCTTYKPVFPVDVKVVKSPPQINIGFCPLVSGLPFYLALKNDWFNQAGLNVVPVRLTTAQQTAEQMITGKLSGFANSTVSSSLALVEIGQPSLFKIVAVNLRSSSYVVDKFSVGVNSKIRNFTDLRNSRVGCTPSPQSVAITRAILQKRAISYNEVIQLHPSKHIIALKSGQVDVVYNLESSADIFQHPQTTKTLATGAFAQDILDDSAAVWTGSLATLSLEFIQQYPQAAQLYIDVYRRAVQTIRTSAIAALAFAKDYAAIPADLAEAVVLANYQLYDELKLTEVKQLQAGFIALHQAKVFTSKVSFSSLLYQDQANG